MFTGLSGSGKSTLAFDTIFAEGQRRYIENFLNYGFGNNAVFFIIFGLDFAASLRFADCPFHTARNFVGVHNNSAFGILKYATRYQS